MQKREVVNRINFLLNGLRILDKLSKDKTLILKNSLCILIKYKYTCKIKIEKYFIS